MILPQGSVCLRADLGEFLKRRRRGMLDGESFGTQAQVAARAGIKRQTLSAIERGSAWPGPATLDALLDIYDLGWEHVAHPVASDRQPRYRVEDMPGGGRLAEMPHAAAPARHRTFLEGVRGNQIIALGETIKAARKDRGMTLARVAAAAGISIALLSRLERGQLTTSHLFGFREGKDDGEPVLVILNPWLAELCVST